MARTHLHPLVAFRAANDDMSQAEAAALVGITQAQWSRLESGKAYARPRVAKRIAKLTGVSLESLLNLGDNDSVVKPVKRQKRSVKSLRICPESCNV